MSTQANSVHTNGTNHVDVDPVCDLKSFLDKKYDYVICGGGAAGLALAARLSEDLNVNVGVLEAGSDRRGDMLIDTPAAFMKTFKNPDYDWAYMTAPQAHNHNLSHHMPRGKVLGGSSAINYMMYVRGSYSDYDDWAKLVGDDAWSSKHMKQYMIKHQALEPIDPDVVGKKASMPFIGENHGTSGPVKTSFNDTFLPIEDDVIKACDEVTGLSKKPMDPWSGDHIGFYYTLGSVVRSGPDKGKRSYSARGYLNECRGRPNIKVLCDALVTRVNLEGDKATGVSLLYGGQSHTVAASREVIVCGGTVQSPAILELSGIGDPDILKAAGVECKIPVPSVGTNLQDHSVGAGVYELTPGNFSADAMHIPSIMEDAQKTLMERAGGPLTTIQSTQGFFPYKMFATPEELSETVASVQQTVDNPKTTPFQRRQLQQVIEQLKSDKSANLQLVLLGATLNMTSEGVADQSHLFDPPADPTTFGISLAVCLQYPASRGTVHITSSDPTVHPRLDPGYNSHPADLAVLGTGYKFVDLVAKTSHLKDKLAHRIFPVPELNLQESQVNRKVVQDLVAGEYHPCGSCAMGDTVDSHLRVYGVKGLRVADASIFPNHVSGNICSSVYAVAEKAADIIKADWDYATIK